MPLGAGATAAVYLQLHPVPETLSHQMWYQLVLLSLQGDLTAGEIVEQLVHARALAPIRNVVFMGMGVSVGCRMRPISASGQAHQACSSAPQEERKQPRFLAPQSCTCF